MSNIETFKDEYIELEYWITRKHNQTVKWMIEHEPMYRQDLELFYNLRNMLSHNDMKGHNGTEDLLSISDELLQRFRNFKQEVMDQAQSALKFGISASKIFSRSLTDRVLPAMQVMYEDQYSSIPILDQGLVIGVFCNKVPFAMMCQEGVQPIQAETTFQDISNFIALSPYNLCIYDFIPNSFQRVDAVEKFLSHKSQRNERLDLLFITKDGTPATPLQGIITPYDVLWK